VFLRTTGLSVLASFIVAAGYYFVLFHEVPILLILVDTILYALIVVPVVWVGVFLIRRTIRKSVAGVVLVSVVLIVAPVLGWVTLADADRGGLSQKIAGNWAFVGGSATLYGMVVVGANGLALAAAAIAVIWQTALRGKYR